MADKDQKPKDAKGDKSQGGAGKGDPLKKSEEGIFVILFFVFIAIVSLEAIRRFYLSFIDPNMVITGVPAMVRGFLTSFWLRGISSVLSLGLFAFFTVLTVKLGRINKGIRQGLKEAARLSDEGVPNSKWQRVLENIASPNSSDWKLAIIEADIMLEEMLEAMGYRGESMGDILKRIEKSDFNTIDQAWEAHKVRNAIAHEGADFLLTEREARRIIGLYEEVFKEFKYI